MPRGTDPRSAKEKAVAKGCKSREIEEKTLVLEDVDYIGETDWQEILSESMESVISRRWKFGNGIDKTMLRYYERFLNVVVL